MSKYITDRPGPARTGVWAILLGDQLVGKIIVAYPQDGAGRVYLTLWDWTTYDSKMQSGWAGGYGYDKVANILKGMTFNGVSLNEGDWKKSIESQGYQLYNLL